MKNSSPKKLSADCWSTVGQQSAHCWLIVGQLSADCHLLPFTKIFCQQSADCGPFVGRLSADCWPFVGRLSADCWQHIGNLLAKCRLRTPVEYQKSLSSQGRILHIDAKCPPYCLGFLWTNLLCLGFLGIKPLTIPSHHPHSQEAKNVFTAASCSFFFFLLY